MHDDAFDPYADDDDEDGGFGEEGDAEGEGAHERVAAAREVEIGQQLAGALACAPLLGDDVRETKRGRHRVAGEAVVVQDGAA